MEANYSKALNKLHNIDVANLIISLQKNILKHHAQLNTQRIQMR